MRGVWSWWCSVPTLTICPCRWCSIGGDKIKKVYGSYIRLLDTIERAVLKKHPGIPICWVYYTYKDGMKALKEDLDPPTIVRGMFKPRSDIIKEARAADAA